MSREANIKAAKAALSHIKNAMRSRAMQRVMKPDNAAHLLGDEQQSDNNEHKQLPDQHMPDEAHVSEAQVDDSSDDLGTEKKDIIDVRQVYNPRSQGNSAHIPSPKPVGDSGEGSVIPTLRKKHK